MHTAAADAMSEAALKKWRDDEQHTFADYFSKIDLSGKWQNWLISKQVEANWSKAKQVKL